MNYSLRKMKSLPFKNLAISLLFAVFLGPIGLLYSSLWSGVIMIVLAFITVSSKLLVPNILIWLISCILSVAATNRYNKKLMEVYFNEEKNNQTSPASLR